MVVQKANEAIYDLRWQVRRIKLVKMWNDFDIDAAIQICDDYYHKSDETNLKSRLWRIINCMNAVVMGWNGSKAVSQATRTTLLAKREYWQGVYRVVQANNDQPWEIECDPGVLTDQELKDVYRSLRKRWNAAPQVWNRPMLWHVVLLLEAEMRRRGHKVAPLARRDDDRATVVDAGQ